MATENKLEFTSSSSSSSSTDVPLKISESINTRLADEISYVFGVSNFAFSAYIMGKAPHLYWIYHSLKNSFLLVDRLIKYTKKHQQLYLLEFCYICNYITFLYTFLCLLRSSFPGLAPYFSTISMYEERLFQVLFSWSVGVLLAAIVCFRNSIVFHSSDHTTILATHISPNLAIYGMKWYFADLNHTFPSMFRIGCDANTCGSATLFDLIVVPAICYLLFWSLPYSFYMFFYGRKMIEEQKLIHMYSFTETSPTWKSWKEKYFHEYAPFVYMSIHFTVCTLSYILAYFSWHSFWFHSLYLVLVLEVAIWNGSTYYFEVFADKYAMSHPKMSKKPQQNYGSTAH